MGFLSKLGLDSVGKVLGVASGGTTLLGTALAGGETLYNNYQQRKAAKKQREWDLQMWNMQNEYNTPAQQMSRLAAAGLNPSLIYGAGSATASGNASSKPSGDNRFVARQLQLMSALKFQQDLEAKGADISNTRAQNAVIRGQALLQRQTLKLNSARTDLIAQQIDLAKEQIAKLKHDIKYAEDHNMPTGHIAMLRYRMMAGLDWTTKLLGYSVGSAFTGISNFWMRRKMNNAFEAANTSDLARPVDTMPNIYSAP